jgi:hypothetical protein
MLLLVAALLFNLTLTGLFALSTAKTGFYRAIDLERRSQATYLAEAGLHVAARNVQNMSSLKTLTLPYPVVTSTVLGDGTYSAVLANNPSDPGGATTDTDGIYLLRATGVAKGQARRRTVESAVVVTPTNLAVPGVITIGDKVTSRMDGSNKMNGFDADVAGLAVAGIAYEKAGQTTTNVGGSTVTGTPDFSWANSAFTSGTGFNSQAQQMIAGLAANVNATHITNSSCNMSGSFGTAADPKITVIDPGVSAKISGSGSGVGVLVIRGRFEVSGTFNFTGLILIDGSAGPVRLGGSGTYKGAVVVTRPSSDPVCEVLEAKDGGLKITYSKSAVDWAGTQLPGLVFRSYALKN